MSLQRSGPNRPTNNQKSIAEVCPGFTSSAREVSINVAGPIPNQTARARLPARKGRGRFGFLMRSTSRATNSSNKLDP